MEQALTKGNGGAVQTVRQEFGTTEYQKQFETAAIAVAAREEAAIRARYSMAIQFPRNMDQFRVELLKDCRRPGFAAVARYSKPMGNTSIEGPSIRFVETALRHYRNILPEVTTVYDDDKLRICRVVVSDLESNIAYATEVQVQKAVERRGYEDKRTGKVSPPKGRAVISERINSYGDPVFLVEATDDEVISKQNALISKAIRTNALRLLPGDIVEEAQQAVIATVSKEIVDDPEAARRKIIDAFAALKVEPEDLQQWAEKPLDKLTAKEWADLRAIGMAIKDGDTTWDEVMRAKDPTGSVEAAEKVAADKLANIRKQEQQKQPDPPQQTEKQPPTEEEMRNEDPEQQRQIQEERARNQPKQQGRIAFGRTNK